MNISVSENPEKMGQAAGKAAGESIRNVIREKGEARIILATGTSQFEVIRQLVSEPGIDWSKVTMFHLDEYIGLPLSHPASFRKYLKERFLDQVGPLKAAHLINGEAGDPAQEVQRLGELIGRRPVDVALVGIGENGHLAFNDPPADFDTEAPYLIVELDLPCRKQQLGEGWFGSLEEVPRQAISMSVKQIMKAVKVICSVPDKRKAEAVRNTLEQEVSNLFPASILRQHPDCVFYLDEAAASLLSR